MHDSRFAEARSEAWLDAHGVPDILAESVQSEHSYGRTAKSMAFLTPDIAS